MMTFHSLCTLQQFKFDPNIPFAAQIKTLEIACIKLVDCGKIITNNNMALAMLMGLPDSWSNIVSTFLAMQADFFKVSPNVVQKCIIDESDHLTGSSGTTHLSSIHCTHDSTNLTSTSFTSCSRFKHNCYTCGKCGPRGHLDKYCWVLHPELKGKGAYAKSNVTTAVAEPHLVPPDIATSSMATLNALGNESSILFYYDMCNDWMINSGTSDHISKFPADFIPGSVCNTPGLIQLRNNSTIPYLGIGEVHITTSVLYTPEASG
jgi:hypothetical protein